MVIYPYFLKSPPERDILDRFIDENFRRVSRKKIKKQLTRLTIYKWILLLFYSDYWLALRNDGRMGIAGWKGNFESFSYTILMQFIRMWTRYLNPPLPHRREPRTQRGKWNYLSLLSRNHLSDLMDKSNSPIKNPPRSLLSALRSCQYNNKALSWNSRCYWYFSFILEFPVPLICFFYFSSPNAYIYSDNFIFMHSCMIIVHWIWSYLIQSFLQLPQMDNATAPIFPSAMVTRLHLKTQSFADNSILRATASIGARPV